MALRAGPEAMAPIRPAARRSRLTALEVPPAAIAPDPQQPRLAPAAPGLEALAASLRARGVIQPLLVRPHPRPEARAHTPYMLIAGGRRWAAARLAGLATVPIVLREEELAPAERLMVQLDENDGELRRSLPLYDRALAIQRAYRLSGLTKEQFTRLHHKSPSWLSHYLRLAMATGPLREALAEERLNGILLASLYSRLPVEEQARLLASARRTGIPITATQIEIAAQRHDRTTASDRDAATGSDVGAAPEAGGDAAAGADAGGAELTPLPVLLTPRQLAILLRRLGLHPRRAARERVEQLYSCLA